MFLASYDLKETSPDAHGHVLTEAYKFGWFYFDHKPDGKVYRLPNTTLISHHATLEEALRQFGQLLERAKDLSNGRLVLNKYFVTRIVEYDFASDDVILKAPG